MATVTCLARLGPATMAAEGIMAKAATYTEEDLREAFLCGVKQGNGHEEGDPEPEIEHWIDCLFYQGFRTDTLFNRPAYFNGKPRAAQAGKQESWRRNQTTSDS